MNYILPFQGILGILFIFFLTFLLSEKKNNIKWRYVIQGFFIQLLLASLALYFPPLKMCLTSLSECIVVLKEATLEGTKFVFGYMGGADLPFHLTPNSHGVIFAFQILPLLIVVSALSMFLFHIRVLPFIVRLLSPIFQKLLNIGGAMGVVASAKLFLSQMETPLLIKPYIAKFSRTEILMVIACGMSTTSAAAIPLYSMILEHTFDHVISHILIASLISIPASLTLSRILIPEDNVKTEGDIIAPQTFKNSLDALSRGASDGMHIFWNIIAQLIVFAAAIYLLNIITKKITGFMLGDSYTLQHIIGYIFSPFTWLMGIPWHESHQAASLLGTKTLLNEVFAFTELTASTLSLKSKTIMLYALCGFANFSSVGMVIGSLGTLVPERRDDIVKLAPKALLTGTLATCLSGTIIGLLKFQS
jgi:CNT family concentrative nucleoside transporter